jgi:hypothetical protein
MNENLLEKRPHLIPAAIAALMLFGALAIVECYSTALARVRA